MIPKSLHTITAFTNLARHILDTSDTTPAEAIDEAIRILGYGEAADVYELGAAALRNVLKALPKGRAEYSAADWHYVMNR